MKYLIAELDISENLNYYRFDTEEELDEYTKTALGDIHSPVREVRLYRLEKIGRRVSNVQWTNEQQGTNNSRKYDMDVIANPPIARGKHKRWTQEEIVYMREAKKMGMSSKGIAHKLNRTAHAVEVKASRTPGCN